MDRSINAYKKLANRNSLWLWLENATAGAVQFYEGQGVCYDAVYGTAANVDAQRYNRCCAPSSTLAAHFAGVLAADYLVPVGGTLVQVYGPGSVCLIRVAITQSVVINSSVLECTYTSGTWKIGATSPGKGCANALQTYNTSAGIHKVLAVLQEGAQSALQTD